MQKGLYSNIPIIKRRHRTFAKQKKLISNKLRHIPKLVVANLIFILVSKNNLKTTRLLGLYNNPLCYD
jgi:hypothetical protein